VIALPQILSARTSNNSGGDLFESGLVFNGTPTKAKIAFRLPHNRCPIYR
jgi:hypothetical protein